jgi:S-adenosylmethionine:tRNA ribosyltransferase-isomerase
MKRQDFSFDLPEALIARYPLPDRAASRLLVVDRARGTLTDSGFAEIGAWLRAGDVLVCNDTRVIPARLFGRKPSGGQVEMLIERVLDDTHALAQVRASKTPQPGGEILLEDGVSRATVTGRAGDLFALTFTSAWPLLVLLERIGHVPLPPYMSRADEANDRERYQTIFAREPGAVAAPTAGLHFSEALLATLRAQGVVQTFVTLHVGAGTFQPVRVDDIAAHKMHGERFSVPNETVEHVVSTHAAGGRVVAVGTTAVRALEAASAAGALRACAGETAIFITPGYEFRCVDALITNFHLPESTLLMLVSAFAGLELTRQAYQHAVRECYRFYSYGDAMLIL